MRRDHKSHMGSPCRSVFTFILISMSLIRFQESKQDLIGLSLHNKREIGSLYLAIDILALKIEFYQ